MPACISSLDSNALALRLAELAGEEREIQVDFLLHLAEFDARRAYAEAGYSSLWSYCLEVLHLREGAAGRRIGAMRVLVRFPRLEAALRDGRLALSTIVALGPVLTEENVDALLARAAFRTKREVEELVVSVKPRPAPTPGLRKVPARSPAVEPAPLALTVCAAALAPAGVQLEDRERAAAIAAARVCPAPPPRIERGRPGELEAVAQDRWSLRATVDRAFKDELETLRCLLAHKVPDGDLTKVLHEAIRCAVEKHGKRRGAVSPGRKASRPAPSAMSARAPSAAVQREVWQRDGGRCTFVAKDGRRCGDRWKLEFDHVDEEGPPTAANLRLRCRAHNLLHAEDTYGRPLMDLFRRDPALAASRSPASAHKP